MRTNLKTIGRYRCFVQLLNFLLQCQRWTVRRNRAKLSLKKLPLWIQTGHRCKREKTRTPPAEHPTLCQSDSRRQNLKLHSAMSTTHTAPYTALRSCPCLVKTLCATPLGYRSKSNCQSSTSKGDNIQWSCMRCWTKGDEINKYNNDNIIIRVVQPRKWNFERG